MYAASCCERGGEKGEEGVRSAGALAAAVAAAMAAHHVAALAARHAPPGSPSTAALFLAAVGTMIEPSLQADCSTWSTADTLPEALIYVQLAMGIVQQV